jgi:hypothetical protein
MIGKEDHEYTGYGIIILEKDLGLTMNKANLKEH